MIFEQGYFRSSRFDTSIINESLKKSRGFNLRDAYDTKRTVFLSHKHKDLQDIEDLVGVYDWLEGLSVSVYIDSMDNKMPEQTSGETAARIKDMIKYCNKFVLLATERAISSFWCNWELGIGDTHKFIENIAILPIKDKGASDFSYKGNEYLQIYPRISFNNSFTNKHGRYFREGYYVEKPIDKNGTIFITELSVWLKQ